MRANPSKRASTMSPNALARRSTCSSRSGTVIAMWSIPGVIILMLQSVDAPLDLPCIPMIWHLRFLHAYHYIS